MPLGVCHCPCCCTPENEALLASTPLRELRAELLSEYTNSAHGYDEARDGTVLRHFLPRYLELIAQGQPPHYGDYAFCLSRLRAADYRRRWAPREACVIDRFFDALLIEHLADTTVSRSPAGWWMAAPVRDVVTMAVLAGADAGRILAAWRSAPDPGAALHLSAFAGDLEAADGPPSLSSPLLKGAPDAVRAIAGFLTEPTMHDRLEAAFFAPGTTAPLQEIASRTLELLEAFSPARR